MVGVEERRFDRDGGSAGFEILITADRGIRYQQNLANRRIALIVLNTNLWPTIRANVAPIINAIEAATEGSYSTVHVAGRSGRGMRLSRPINPC